MPVRALDSCATVLSTPLHTEQTSRGEVGVGGDGAPVSDDIVFEAECDIEPGDMYDTYLLASLLAAKQNGNHNQHDAALTWPQELPHSSHLRVLKRTEGTISPGAR